MVERSSGQTSRQLAALPDEALYLVPHRGLADHCRRVLLAAGRKPTAIKLVVLEQMGDADRLRGTQRGTPWDIDHAFFSIASTGGRREAEYARMILDRYSFMENGGVRYTETEVFELSAVTIPAQADAIINQIKSIDAALRKEAGVPDPEIPANPEPAAVGKSVRVVKLDDPARDRAKPFVINTIRRI